MTSFLLNLPDPAEHGYAIASESGSALAERFRLVRPTVPDVDATVAEWVSHGAVAHRGPKTIMTGERLCQLLDPFGNLFGVRQPPV